MPSSKKGAPAVKVSKVKAERALTWHVVNKIGLPRGPMIRLLSENRIDPKVIEKLATVMVPYGHTAPIED